jgi:hypothetical protein
MLIDTFSNNEWDKLLDSVSYEAYGYSFISQGERTTMWRIWDQRCGNIVWSLCLPADAY